MIPLILFIFGLIIGSFANVVIFRLFLNDSSSLPKDIVNSRSCCPTCHHGLAWVDMIPVLSYFFLIGRCRYCKTKISPQYPVVELVMGALFALYGYLYLSNFSFSLPTIIFHGYNLFVIFLLVLIVVIDYAKYIIPNSIVFTLIGLSIITEPIWAILGFKHQAIDFNEPLFNLYWLAKIILQKFMIELSPYHPVSIFPSYLDPILAGSLAFLFFYLIIILTRGKGMGAGDVKLAIFMGLFLGLDKIGIAIYLAFIFGAVVSLMLVVKGQKTLKQIVPFGPFLVLGLFSSWFFSEHLRLLYQNIVSLFIRS